MIGLSGQILVRVSFSLDINEPVNTTQTQGLRLNDNFSLIEVALNKLADSQKWKSMSFVHSVGGWVT